jgi:hypothetical protein
MVAGLNIGDRVRGLSAKVLAKGDFSKADRQKYVYGVITAVDGKGKSRRWTIKWDNAAKSTTCHARSLDAVQSDTDSSGSGSTSTSGPDSSEEEDDDSDGAPIPALNSTVKPQLVPHGLIWKQVSDVTVDEFSSPKFRFSIKWQNDLPIGNRRPFDFFWALFPATAFESFIEFTNAELTKASQRVTTKGEFFRFIGLIYAMSIVSYGDRRSYWGLTDPGDLFPLPNFGKYGIGVNRFETILRYLRCSGPSDDADRWSHIRAVVNAFNDHRASCCSPSWCLCVDEKTSSFRPRKGVYCDDGPPTLTKIIRKPKSVSIELKDCTDAQTRITLRLELQEGKEAMRSKQFADRYNSGTSILLRLVSPWFHSGRMVVGDSAFASVEAAIACHDRGIHFSGLVKTATRRFPMAYLNALDLLSRGDHAVCVSKPSASCQLLAVAWNGGKKRKCIVSTSGVTTLAAKPATRIRYTNVGDGTSVKTEKVTPWPQVVSNYFLAANASDVNNHYRQGSLKLEESWITHTWWHRPLATVLGTIEADAYLAYLAFNTDADKLSHRDFTEEIASGLIHNSFDDSGSTGDEIQLRKRKRADPDTMSPICNLKLLSSSDAARPEKGSRRTQRTCRVCGKKASYYCDACSNPENSMFFGICGPGSGRDMNCFLSHVATL